MDCGYERQTSGGSCPVREFHFNFRSSCSLRLLSSSLLVVVVDADLTDGLLSLSSTPCLHTNPPPIAIPCPRAILCDTRTQRLAPFSSLSSVSLYFCVSIGEAITASAPLPTALASLLFASRDALPGIFFIASALRSLSLSLSSLDLNDDGSKSSDCETFN